MLVDHSKKSLQTDLFILQNHTFSNGAADIFGMLVEVVASDVPKANLAIGQLLGKFFDLNKPISQQTFESNCFLYANPARVCRVIGFADCFFYCRTSTTLYRRQLGNFIEMSGQVTEF